MHGSSSRRASSPRRARPGWAEAATRFREQCLGLAPRPGEELGKPSPRRLDRHLPADPRRRVLPLRRPAQPASRAGLDVATSRPYEPGDDVDASTRTPPPGCRSPVAPRSSSSASTTPRRPAWGPRRPETLDVDLRRRLAVAPKPEAPALDAVDRRQRGHRAGAASATWTRPTASPTGDRLAPSTSSTSPTESVRSAPPGDALERGLVHLVAQRRDLPAGSFLFVLSDFLAPPSHGRLAASAGTPMGGRPCGDPGSGVGAELPELGGAVVPLADPGSGEVSLVRAPPERGGGAARRQRASLRELVQGLRALDMDLCSSPRTSIGRSCSPVVGRPAPVRAGRA